MTIESSQRILVIEDNEDTAQTIRAYLVHFGYHCDVVHSGVTGLELFGRHGYHLVLLDVMLPDLDGFAVCKRLKDSGNDTPVIFLTARDGIDDKLQGFELGADDYLTKPFEVDELVARIKVLAKRQVKTAKCFELDSLVIDYPRRQVVRADREVPLSVSQWQLLTLLARHSPNLVSKQDIENEIWPEQDVNKDMYKTLIFRLRNLVDTASDKPLIHTVRGAGIALKVLD